MLLVKAGHKKKVDRVERSTGSKGRYSRVG